MKNVATVQSARTHETEHTQQTVKVRTALHPKDIERWASGFGNHENFCDSSDGFGRCRWCGGKMSAHYPRNGRALNYRCCSMVCQLLYAAHIGYFGLPVKGDGVINFAEGRRRLSALEGLEIRGNLVPVWFDKAKPTLTRYCGNTTDGQHSLPHNARKSQRFCNSRCRVAAHRAKRAELAPAA